MKVTYEVWLDVPDDKVEDVEQALCDLVENDVLDTAIATALDLNGLDAAIITSLSAAVTREE